MNADYPPQRLGVEGYMGTIERLEPNIHPIDAGAFYASAAISLRRIADNLDWFKTVAKLLLQIAANEEPLPANLQSKLERLL